MTGRDFRYLRTISVSSLMQIVLIFPYSIYSRGSWFITKAGKAGLLVLPLLRGFKSRECMLVCFACLLGVMSLASCGSSSDQQTTALSRHQIAREVQRRVKEYTGCMMNHGITLPAGESDISAWLMGGKPLPANVTTTQAELALRQCHGGRRRVVGNIITDPATMSGSARFATCLRENGLIVQGPNISGHGPALTITNTRHMQLTAVERRCAKQLVSSAFPHQVPSVIEAGNVR